MTQKCCIKNVLEPNHSPAKGRYCNAMVEDSLNKKIYFYDYCGNFVSWSQEGADPGPPPEPDVFTVTLPVSNPEEQTYIAWTATQDSTAIRFLALRHGGIGATVNVLKNGQPLLVTDLSLSVADAWLEGAPLTDTLFQEGDVLSFSVTAVAGAVDSISFSMEFTSNV